MKGHFCRVVGEYVEDDSRYPLYDGYGIFLTYVCKRCEYIVTEGYRDDIFERYDADEEIEPD